MFEQCTDTIVRQVDDIKRMVDEFSRFARMPKPVIAAEDVADTVRQVVFLMRVGNADIDIEVESAGGPDAGALRPPADLAGADQHHQERDRSDRARCRRPSSAAAASSSARARDGKDIVIDVIDNGIGLPKENRSRLLEPYVTTREKGTGLGLAIVGRILEEHGGGIELRDAVGKDSRRSAAPGCDCALPPRRSSAAGEHEREPQQARNRGVNQWHPTS